MAIDSFRRPRARSIVHNALTFSHKLLRRRRPRLAKQTLILPRTRTIALKHPLAACTPLPRALRTPLTHHTRAWTLLCCRRPDQYNPTQCDIYTIVVSGEFGGFTATCARTESGRSAQPYVLSQRRGRESAKKRRRASPQRRFALRPARSGRAAAVQPRLRCRGGAEKRRRAAPRRAAPPPNNDHNDTDCYAH